MPASVCKNGRRDTPLFYVSNHFYGGSEIKIKAITNATIVLENSMIWDGVIIVTDDKITTVGPRRETEIPKEAEIIDAGGAYVGPGFVDLHVHGGISGSKLTMDMACRNIMAHTGCGIAQAFAMASLNPAKVLGMDKEIGSIAVGKTADLVFVDDKFDVKQVVLGGELQKFSEA